MRCQFLVFAISHQPIRPRLIHECTRRSKTHRRAALRSLHVPMEVPGSASPVSPGLGLLQPPRHQPHLLLIPPSPLASFCPGDTSAHCECTSFSFVPAVPCSYPTPVLYSYLHSSHSCPRGLRLAVPQLPHSFSCRNCSRVVNRTGRCRLLVHSS